MGNVKSLPTLERPREKALRYGLTELSDYELLALLIGSGYHGINVIELSTSLLVKYGGLKRLVDIPFCELKKNKGIKNVKALNLAAIFEFHKRLLVKESEEIEEEITSEYLYNKYLPVLAHSKQEQLILVILSKYKHIIHESILYKGSSDGFKYSWQNIYDEILNYGGKSFYLIHNHPDGDCLPSRADKLATHEIVFESRKVRKPMLDHIIISSEGYYSFKKNEKN